MIGITVAFTKLWG